MTGSRLEKCASISRLMTGLLLLTGGAIVSGARSLGQRAHLRPAAPAGLSGAFVRVQALAEVARQALGRQIVAQRRAAGTDREPQHRAHGAHQARALRLAQRTRGARRADTGAKQRLARVDVA